MKGKGLTRRDFLRLSAGAAAGAALVGCQPEVVKETVEVEREVTKVVETEKIVEVTPTPARDVASLPNAATGIPYEIKPSINNGEPIEFEMKLRYKPDCVLQDNECEPEIAKRFIQ